MTGGGWLVRQLLPWLWLAVCQPLQQGLQI